MAEDNGEQGYTHFSYNRPSDFRFTKASIEHPEGRILSSLQETAKRYYANRKTRGSFYKLVVYLAEWHDDFSSRNPYLKKTPIDLIKTEMDRKFSYVERCSTFNLEEFISSELKKNSNAPEELMHYLLAENWPEFKPRIDSITPEDMKSYTAMIEEAINEEKKPDPRLKYNIKVS